MQESRKTGAIVFLGILEIMRLAIKHRPAKAPEGWSTPGRFATNNGYLDAGRDRCAKTRAGRILSPTPAIWLAE
jgi:hypothetical protein